MSCIDETFMELQNARGGVITKWLIRLENSKVFRTNEEQPFGVAMVTTEEWVGISVVREDKEKILITTTITWRKEEEEATRSRYGRSND